MKPEKVYACYSKDKDVRLSSSSGAVFSSLAEYVLNKNGIIYGVAMSEDCYSAEFIAVTDRSELIKLRGSKYLQAKVGDTFKKVKVELQSGKLVLFTGTGCQVNGLKKFLGKDYENLICMDVICHGARRQPFPRSAENRIRGGTRARLPRRAARRFYAEPHGIGRNGMPALLAAVFDLPPLRPLQDEERRPARQKTKNRAAQGKQNPAPLPRGRKNCPLPQNVRRFKGYVRLFCDRLRPLRATGGSVFARRGHIGFYARRKAAA